MRPAILSVRSDAPVTDLRSMNRVHAPSVRRLVMGQGLGSALAGILIGVPLALALARLMRGLVFGVPTSDPVKFVAVPLLLLWSPRWRVPCQSGSPTAGT